ncbi:MAG: hypothetical protein MSJ87_01955 [Firmicutes bacterium]|nr:hypothetical protein [Bacillota bacterium]
MTDFSTRLRELRLSKGLRQEQVADTNISFYLKASRIHIFIDALRGLGSPSRICFMIDELGKILLITPYRKTFGRIAYRRRHMLDTEAWRYAAGSCAGS